MPIAEMNFDQAWIRMILRCRQIHGRASDLHRLSRADHRACDEVETLRVSQQFLPQAIAPGLATAGVVQRDILLSLEAVL